METKQANIIHIFTVTGSCLGIQWLYKRGVSQSCKWHTHTHTHTHTRTWFDAPLNALLGFCDFELQFQLVGLNIIQLTRCIQIHTWHMDSHVSTHNFEICGALIHGPLFYGYIWLAMISQLTDWEEINCQILSSFWRKNIQFLIQVS